MRNIVFLILLSLLAFGCTTTETKSTIPIYSTAKYPSKGAIPVEKFPPANTWTQSPPYTSTDGQNTLPRYHNQSSEYSKKDNSGAANKKKFSDVDTTLVSKVNKDNHTEVTMNAIDVFKSKRAWKKLPSDFLNSLANKLNTVENATEFAQLCEKTGILKNNIYRLVDSAGGDSEFAVGGVAATLTSYANTLGDKKQYSQAERVLELALLLNPKHSPAWSSMALVAFYQGDCRTAVVWADRVLSYKPDLKGNDFWERAHSELEMGGGLEQVHEFMKSIKKACLNR